MVWGNIDLAAFAVLQGFETLEDVRGGGSSKSLNGNSKQSLKKQHLYEIKSTATDEVLEYGISGQKLNANGISPRVAQKIRTKYNGDPNVYGNIIEKDIQGRLFWLNKEQQKVNDFSLLNGGRVPVNQIRPKPKQ